MIFLRLVFLVSSVLSLQSSVPIVDHTVSGGKVAMTWQTARRKSDCVLVCNIRTCSTTPPGPVCPGFLRPSAESRAKRMKRRAAYRSGSIGFVRSERMALLAFLLLVVRRLSRVGKRRVIHASHAAPIANLACLLLLSTVLESAHAQQPGRLDTSFDPGLGADNWAGPILFQPDGKIVVAGGFATFDGVPRSGIVRLDANGSVDRAFDPGTGANDSVWAAGQQSDDKSIIGGRFTEVDGIPRTWLARLETSGKVDSNFSPKLEGFEYLRFGTTRLGAPVTALALDSSGKILVGGGFTVVNGERRLGLARLNPNGSLDASFTAPFVPFTNYITGSPSVVILPRIEAMAVQEDGKVLVGGAISTNGTAYLGFARLNTDGSLDHAFASQFRSGTGSGSVSAIAVQRDLKILIGGSFTAINDQPRLCLARLNPDGKLDASFQTRLGNALNAYPTFNQVFAIAALADGKILIGGLFKEVEGSPRNHIARLNADGTLDPEFHPGQGTSDGGFKSGDFPQTRNSDHPEVSGIAVQPDGRILIAGNFLSFDGVPSAGLARLMGGAAAPAPPVIVTNPTNQIELIGGAVVFAVEVLSTLPVTSQWLFNGQPLPGATNLTLRLAQIQNSQTGNYSATVRNASGFVTSSVATLEVRDASIGPGSLDPTFAPKPDGRVFAVAVQKDGQILVGGDFLRVDGRPATNMARLNLDGSVDASFDAGAGAYSKSTPASIRALAIQNDGRIMIGGLFQKLNGTPRSAIARVHPDGRLDDSFNPGSGFGMSWPSGVAWVDRLQLQADGKIIAGGTFELMNGVPVNGVARLNSDGTLDPTFKAQFATDPMPLRQSDGKFLVREPKDFFALLKRYDADGTLDPNFGLPADFALRGMTSPLLVQPDDKILADSIQLVRDPTNGRIISAQFQILSRFNSDGSGDATFRPARVTGGFGLFSLGTQTDGAILIAGDFVAVNGIPRSSIARLRNDAPDDPPFFTAQPASTTTLLGQAVRFEANVSSLQPPRFQWQFQQRDIPGATNRSYEIALAHLRHAGEYRVIVSNGAGTTTSSAARLTIVALPAGAVDASFRPGRTLAGAVDKIARLSDGKFLIGGSFTNVDGAQRGGIARLNADGGLDQTFNPGIGLSGGTNVHARALAVQADGKILVGGQFAQFNGVERQSIALLNSDGTLDGAFRPVSGPDRSVKSVAVQANGQVLVGGTFRYTSDFEHYLHLVRLNGEGSLDPGYDPSPSGARCHAMFCWDVSAVNALLVQPDGKALVAGGFYGAGLLGGKGGGRGLLRLDANGIVDANLQARLTLHDSSQLDLSAPVLADMVQQPDGKLVAVGKFSHYPTRDLDPIIQKLDRFNADGSRDPSFVADVTQKNTDGEVTTVALQPDGKILIGGAFKTVKGVPRNNVARFDPDGTLDLLFDPGVGPNGAVNTIVALDDDSCLIGGSFTHVGGIEQHGLARLFTKPDALPKLANPVPTGGGFSIMWPTAAGKSYVLEFSDSLSGFPWTRLTTVSGDGSVKSFLDPAPTEKQRFYRIRLE